MASFKDNAGKSWKVNVTVATVRRVKELTGVYLPALADEQFKEFNELAQDVIRFIDVLYATCMPDAEANKVTIDQFGESLGGDSIERAAQALADGIVDFFPEARRRALQTYLEKAKTVRTRLAEKGQSELDKIDPEKIAEELLEKLSLSASKSSDSSGSVPASSDSTPAPSASENSSP